MVPLASSGTFTPVRPILTSYTFTQIVSISSWSKVSKWPRGSVLSTLLYHLSWKASLSLAMWGCWTQWKPIPVICLLAYVLEECACLYYKVHTCTIWCVLDTLWLFHHLFNREIITMDAFHELLVTIFKLLWAFDNLSSIHHDVFTQYPVPSIVPFPWCLSL